MLAASSEDSSLRTITRFQRALAVSTSIKSGARSSASLFKNCSRRKSAAALSGSCKNHLSTTLASTTQVKVSGLGPRESELRCRKEFLPSCGCPHGAHGSARPGHASTLTDWRDSLYFL